MRRFQKAFPPSFSLSAISGLGEMFAKAVAAFGEKDALIIDDTRWTYAELGARAHTVAAALHRIGLTKGDEIGIFAENCPEYIELILGAAISGIIPVPINTMSLPPVLAERLRTLSLKVLFVSKSDGYDHLSTAKETLDILSQDSGPDAFDQLELYVIGQDDDEVPNYRQFIASDTENNSDKTTAFPAIGLSDPFVIMFTSGFSGRSRTCHISHENILCKLDPISEHLEITAESRFWLPIGMFQVGFLVPFLAALSKGCAVVTMTQFKAKDAVALLINEKITHAYPLFLRHWLPVIGHVDFRPSLVPGLMRACLIGPSDTLRRVQRAVPQCVIVTTYGLVSSAGAFCSTDASSPSEIRLESVGKPFKGHEVRIAKLGTGELLGKGDWGEIQVRGAGIVVQREQDRFSPPFTSDGWLRTGDLGSIGIDGSLYFHGRLSDILTVGSSTVSAFDIEAALGTHPAVLMAQVIGLPDKKLGQVPAAFIETRRNEVLEPEELLDFCRTRLSDAELPRYITFVTEWPTSASKVIKHLLIGLPVGPKLIP